MGAVAPVKLTRVVRCSVVNSCGLGIIRSHCSDSSQCYANGNHGSDRQAGAGNAARTNGCGISLSYLLCWLSWGCWGSSGLSRCWGSWISWGCRYCLGEHLARNKRHRGEDGDNFLHMNSFGLITNKSKYNTIRILL